MLDIAKNNIQLVIEEDNDRLIDASYYKAIFNYQKIKK